MLGCPHDRPVVLDDAVGQQQPALWSQGCVSVDHGGLLPVGGCLSNFHLRDRRPSVFDDQRVVAIPQPTCLGSTA